MNIILLFTIDFNFMLCMGDISLEFSMCGVEFYQIADVFNIDRRIVDRS